jgi:hypothetical protein
MRLRKARLAVLCCGILVWFGPAAGAQNAVAQAVQRLRLSPQQLLSLRDFLGPFSRDAAVEASGAGLFVLRDSHTMAYAGEFSIGLNPDGSLQVDRVSGPATLDATHAVLVPLRLDAKLKARLLGALSGSEMLAPPADSADAVAIALHPVASLPEQWIAGAALTQTKTAADITQARAVFFRDGSGSVQSMRFPVAALPQPATPRQTVPPTPPMLHVGERYFSPIRSDGKSAWRDAVFQVDGDVQIGFSDLEARFGCAVGASCAPRGRMPPASSAHVIRWTRQLVAAVPPSLMAQMSPAQTQVVPAASPSTNPPLQPSSPQPEENSNESPPGR